MQHLAIIPDGNRRWAIQNKLASFLGHQRGVDVVRTAITFCIKNSIKYLSFYTFSLENFRRSETEKNYLFNNLLRDCFIKELPELIKNGVRVRFLGEQSLFPEDLRETIHHIETETKHLDVLHMNLLFCYGATLEITQAVKKIAQQVRDGLLSVESIDESTVRNALWTGDIPDPDLIVRTGGVVRLSNFLLFQAAYSEFAFLDCYWPDVTEEKLGHCVDQFNKTKRNFGK